MRLVGRQGGGWEHFPHDGVGLRGFGATPARAFEQAARALTAVVTQAAVEPNLAVEVRCEAPDLESLFVERIAPWMVEGIASRQRSGRPQD
jgi:SHS2 domain-containing protein